VQLASQIVSTAKRQAAELRQEAESRATASLAGAQQEAAELLRQASDQAAATRASAEREAEELRAAVLKLSAELGGVASYITENLLSAAPSDTRPSAKPEAGPSARSAAGPAAGSDTGNRQVVAVRVLAILVALLVLFAFTVGTVEVALHGFKL
jgi:hypothetical protein